MSKVWLVRADGGELANEFKEGGFASIGWNLRDDLSQITGRNEMEAAYRRANPGQESNAAVSLIVGQVYAFMREIEPGDHILTPMRDHKWLRCGRMLDEPAFFLTSQEDEHHHPNRRPVKWQEDLLYRYDCADEDQDRMRRRPTVVLISDDAESFWKRVIPGSGGPASASGSGPIDPAVVAALERLIDEVNWRQAQDLIAELLNAMGCEVNCVSPPGPDGGVDIWAVSSDLLTPDVPLFVQVKRYKWGNKVGSKAVRELRGGIKFGGRGVFVTTSSFAKGAREVAIEPDYPYIALIDGPKLIALLREHWDKISPEFRQQLDFLESTTNR